MSYSVIGGTSSDSAKASKGKLKTKNESKELVAENGARIALFVGNPGATDVYLALGATAVSGEGIWLKKEAGAVVIQGYTGKVTAIASSGEPEITYAEI